MAYLLSREAKCDERLQRLSDSKGCVPGVAASCVIAEITKSRLNQLCRVTLCAAQVLSSCHAFRHTLIQVATLWHPCHKRLA